MNIEVVRTKFETTYPEPTYTQHSVKPFGDTSGYTLEALTPTGPRVASFTFPSSYPEGMQEVIEARCLDTALASFGKKS